MNTCKKCGSAIDVSAKVCPNCGEPVNAPKIETRVEKHQNAANAPVKPLGVFGYLWTLVLLNIPVLGFILSIIWACGAAKDPNRRNLARAWLILTVICTAVGIVFAVVNFSVVMSFLETLAV